MSPKSAGWAPGHRALPQKNKGWTTQDRLNLRRLLVAEMERISVSVSDFDYTDKTVSSQMGQGFTPEINEKNILLALTRDDNYLSVNLTALTEEELNALLESIMFAFDTARPIVQARDKVAKEAHDSGDGTYRRLHRGTPKVSRIARKEPTDN